MHKTDLIDTTARATGLSKADTARTIDAALDAICKALVAGDTVALTGFGSFAVSAKAEREGRNPKTGEPVVIAAHNSVKFKARKNLKDAVNA